MQMRRIVPPSGTLTVVETLVVAKLGCCTVVPVVVTSSPSLALVLFPVGESTLVPVRDEVFRVVREPSNVKVLTLSIRENVGFNVTLTNRLSGETTA